MERESDDWGVLCDAVTALKQKRNTTEEGERCMCCVGPPKSATFPSIERTLEFYIHTS
jgi:hypothetical protein